MTALLPIAHHSLVVALPFVLPVLILTVGVTVFALRERRRRERGLQRPDAGPSAAFGGAGARLTAPGVHPRAFGHAGGHRAPPATLPHSPSRDG